MMTIQAKKINFCNLEHYTRMKYLHLGIIFGLHAVDLVLSFLGFSVDQLLELPVGGVFILFMLQ